MQILQIHSRKMNLMRGIDLRKIAASLTDASGAECKVGVRREDDDRLSVQRRACSPFGRRECT